MSHPIETHPLPGIGAGRRTRLADAGILTLEDLVAAGAEKVAALPHFPDAVAARAVAAAQEVLDNGAAAPVEAPVEAPAAEAPPVQTPKVQTPKVETPKVATPKVEAPKVVTATVETPKVETPKAPRGKAGRASQPTVPRWRRPLRVRELVRQARRHAETGPDGRSRRMVLEALTSFERALTRLVDLFEGKPVEQRPDLKRDLRDAEDALQVFIGRKARRRRMRRLAKIADRARAAVDTSLR